MLGAGSAVSGDDGVYVTEVPSGATGRGRRCAEPRCVGRSACISLNLGICFVLSSLFCLGEEGHLPRFPKGAIPNPSGKRERKKRNCSRTPVASAMKGDSDQGSAANETTCCTLGGKKYSWDGICNFRSHMPEAICRGTGVERAR